MKPIRVAIACPEQINGTDFHRLIAPKWAYMKDSRLDIYQCADIIGLTQKQLDGLDVLIVSRVLTRDPSQFSRAKAMIKASPCKLIVDVDDYWDWPPEHAGHAMWKQQNGKRMMLETMKLANAIWTTTSRLKRKIETTKGCPPVYLVPNRINREDPQWNAAVLKSPSTDLRLGVMAAPAHWMNVLQLHDGIKAMNHLPFWRVKAIGVAQQHQNHVKMLLGTDRVDFVPWHDPMNYAKVYQQIDLMLCPLMRNEFNLYRSPIKVLECSRTGTHILAEDYGPYEGAGQVREGGWAALPEIVKAHHQRPPLNQPTLDPHLFSEKPDAVRIGCIQFLTGNTVE